jgi:hypothetical protein
MLLSNARTEQIQEVLAGAVTNRQVTDGNLKATDGGNPIQIITAQVNIATKETKAIVYCNLTYK